MTAALATGCGSGDDTPAPPPAPAAAETPAAAEPVTAAETEPAPVAPPAADPFADAEVHLAERRTDAIRDAVHEDGRAAPRVLASARLDADGATQRFIVYATSAGRDRWEGYRASGEYEARVRELDARIAACEAESADCYDCASCEERHDERLANDWELKLARVTFRGASVEVEARTDLSLSFSGESAARIRELEDLDGDGRRELGIAVSDTRDTGQFGEQTLTFIWVDAETLREQLRFERSAYAFGCSGVLRERSGFSVRDRNGDGRADFGVRHAIWPEACAEEGQWPDPATSTRLDDPDVVRRLALGEPMFAITGDEDAEEPECPFYERRTRYLYDVARDAWVEAPAER